MKEKYQVKFAVNIFYEGKRSDAEASLWEESILLIYALDEDEAIRKAIFYAKKNEHEYISTDAVTIKWVFHAISQINQIDKSLKEDGVEIFSRFLKAFEAKSLLEPFND